METVKEDPLDAMNEAGLKQEEKQKKGAERLLEQPDLLTHITRQLERKLVGERENALTLLLACILSRSKSKALNVVVKGESSGGKTNLTKAVLGLVPKEAMRE